MSIYLSACMSVFVFRLSTLLCGRYATPLSTDLALLSRHSSGEAPLPHNRRMALLLLAGEKRVLGQYLSLATSALQLLSSSSAAVLRARVEACERDCHELALTYCLHSVVPLVSF
jgi:hypothetical protein